MTELVRAGVKVELLAIGEGYMGDYNPDDPMDTPLLRFYVHRFELGTHGLPDGWLEVDDASYCTNLPTDLPEDRQYRALELLMTWFHDEVAAGRSVRKLGAMASWIEPAWLDKPPGTVLLEDDRYPTLAVPQEAP